MSKTSRTGLFAGTLACLTALLPISACKKHMTAPPVAGLALSPVEQTQGKLILTAVMPSLDSSLKRASEIAGVIQIPVSPEEIRQMAFSSQLMAPEAAAHIALDKPIAMAMVAGPTPGADPHAAVAGHARSPADAQKLIDAIGKRGEKKDDAVKVTNSAGKSVWLLSRGDVVIGAETIESLVAAGAQAFAALPTGRADLAVKLRVDAAIAASGKDLKAELQKIRDQALAQSGQKGKASPAAEKYVAQTFDLYIGWLTDTKGIDFELSLAPEDGVRVSANIHPRPGSNLAAQFSDTTPALIDPSFLSKPAPTVLFAWAASPKFLEIYAGLLGSLGSSGIPGAEALARSAQDAMAMMTGATSGRMDAENNVLSYSTSTGLKPDVKPAAVMNALDTVFKSGAINALMGAMDKDMAPKLDYKRKGDISRVSISYPATPQAMIVRKALKSIFGSETVTVAATATGSRVLATTDPGAEKRLAAMVKTPASVTAHPDVEQVLAETRGDSGWGYVDLLALARPIIAIAATQDPGAAQAGAMLQMLPGLKTLRVPLITRFRGGSAMLAQLYIPRRTFEGVGAVVGPLRGMTGGGPSGGPSGSPTAPSR